MSKGNLVKECVFVTTFIIGLVILLGGAALYGRFCEKVFGPDDRKTPAYTKQDGVDYVPMRGWKNSLINLLNIAGTGPILGPIQGILFGPIAFLTIPIGNVIGGAMHDYFSGMICLRDGGTQMPEMIRRYSTKGIYKFYNVFVCVLLLLVGAVFIYTPGDIAATQVFGFSGEALDKLVESATEKAQEVGQTLLSAVVSTVLRSVAYAVVYLVSFLLLLLLLRLLLAPLHLFTKLPVVHGINAVLGGALGLVKGALLLFFAVWLLRRLQIWITPELISQTYILRFFAEHSPMELITSL